MGEKEPLCWGKGSGYQYPPCCCSVHTSSISRSVPSPLQPARAVPAEQGPEHRAHAGWHPRHPQNHVHPSLAPNWLGLDTIPQPLSLPRALLQR